MVKGGLSPRPLSYRPPHTLSSPQWIAIYLRENPIASLPRPEPIKMGKLHGEASATFGGTPEFRHITGTFPPAARSTEQSRAAPDVTPSIRPRFLQRTENLAGILSRGSKLQGHDRLEKCRAGTSQGHHQAPLRSGTQAGIGGNAGSRVEPPGSALPISVNGYPNMPPTEHDCSNNAPKSPSKSGGRGDSSGEGRTTRNPVPRCSGKAATVPLPLESCHRAHAGKLPDVRRHALESHGTRPEDDRSSLPLRNPSAGDRR